MASADILILCGAGYVSGKEVMVLTLAEGLKERGIPVHVCSSTWNDGDFIARLDAQAIAHSQLPFGFISATLRWNYIRMTAEQAYRWPGLLRGYSRLVRDTRPRHVVHTNWHHVFLLFPVLDVSRDILWLHEVIPDLWQHRTFFSLLARRIRKFVAVSHAVAQSLVRAGVPGQKVDVIHNGIPDPGEAAIGVRPASANVRLGIAGQVGAWKGHPDLIEAFALLAAQRPELSLTIFGGDKGPYQDFMRERIEALGLAPRVTWAGFVKDRAGIYGNIDICVVPSRSEDPLPTTAIEGGFWGLPVVATRRGGLPEIIEDGVSGLLVAPSSPSELAAAIDHLAGDRERRTRMGMNARARMKALFSEERFIDEFVSAVRTESEGSGP